MVRRKWFIIWVVFALLIGGVAGAGVQETMEIPYDEGELSNMTFVRSGVAYVKLFSGLSTVDSTYFWNDLIILKDMGVTRVELYINSPGGDAFTGICLSDQITRAIADGFVINGHASGIVASAAVPILAVCSKRYATAGTIFMVHEAALWKWPGRETASDIRSQNDLMGILRDRYIGKLVDNSKLTKEKWEELESKTTWFSAEKAMEYGLVDRIE